MRRCLFDSATSLNDFLRSVYNNYYTKYLYLLKSEISNKLKVQIVQILLKII